MSHGPATPLGNCPKRCRRDGRTLLQETLQVCMSNASSRRELEEMLDHGAELPLSPTDPQSVGGGPARDMAQPSTRPLCPASKKTSAAKRAQLARTETQRRKHSIVSAKWVQTCWDIKYRALDT